ncbi:MAG: hypothetical protein ACRD1X_07885 [Vicinamibacteria bacterium]
MHSLLELHDVEQLLGEAERFSGGNGLVTGVGGFARSILKFSSISVCEVFGYLLASALGVRVPRMQAVWTREAVSTNGVDADPGRIGILVEHHEDWIALRREAAVEIDPAEVARALALCVFDRHEWGEFGQSRGQVYVVDLERLLPPIQPEILLGASDAERVEWLTDLADHYGRTAFSYILEVIEEADQLGLGDQVDQELRRLASLRPETYFRFLRIAGHPLDELLSRFATSVLGRRLNSVAECVDLPTHDAPGWL